MAINLFEIAKKKKIKYFLISYVDFFGVLRSKLVPTHSIKEMQKEGFDFQDVVKGKGAFKDFKVIAFTLLSTIKLSSTSAIISSS